LLVKSLVLSRDISPPPIEAPVSDLLARFCSNKKSIVLS
jgi:hypothetical protein